MRVCVCTSYSLDRFLATAGPPRPEHTIPTPTFISFSPACTTVSGYLFPVSPKTPRRRLRRRDKPTIEKPLDDTRITLLRLLFSPPDFFGHPRHSVLSPSPPHNPVVLQQPVFSVSVSFLLVVRFLHSVHLRSNPAARPCTARTLTRFFPDTLHLS